MDISLNGDLVTKLIADLGGVTQFLDAWVERSADGEDKIDKATIHRWMKGQLPKNAERFMRLAGLLDVDPFALLSADDQAVSAIAETMLEIVQHENSTPAPLKMLREFFGRLREWPPSEIATNYYGRTWHALDFRHDADRRRNFYQTVELAGAVSSLRPQVFHFAYRSQGRFSSRWLEYGFVLREDRTGILRHIFGFSQQMPISNPGQPLRASTWFGQGPATFRVASLHPFSLSTPSKDYAPGECLEFPA